MFSFSELLFFASFWFHTVAAASGPPRWKVLSEANEVQPNYDFVIIGGGTAGLTVADRLTEDGKTTVLVIEHGELVDSPLINTVQGGMQGFNSQLMYSINSVPQVNLRNHTIAVLAGKVVGGSSAVNAMMTVRGTAEDYDRWGSFFANPSGWNWEGIIPYFKKALNFVPPNADVAEGSNIVYDQSFWGNTSSVYTSWPSYQFPGTKIQVEAFRTMPGVEFVSDSGSGRPGVYWFPQFMDPTSVTRSYARTGHYDDIKRDNYQLIAGSKVLRIQLDGHAATGVEFVSARANSTNSSVLVTATKEVILAAGAIHSPQILQRSGIGPKKVLTAANITTVVDLAGVGQNFQDHPMVQMFISFRNFTSSPSAQDLFTNASFRHWADEVWAANKTGPYSIATGNAAAWLPFPVISGRFGAIADKLATQDPRTSLPSDTDASVVAGYAAQLKSFAAAMRGNNTAFYNLGLTGGSSNGIIVDLHPLSRGSVNIDPGNPEGEPIVDYRALTNAVDIEVMTEIMRYTRQYYFNNTATAGFAPRELSPGPKIQSDSELAAYLADTLSPTEFHPAGTCAMMPKELGGVVDQQLRVYGVSNLRVVDASIMPTLPGGNTCQTVYAIAEKAADIIKQTA
ncbi:alcohol oxidase [Coniochaeta sp. PMI_546]|nr:alcohol oxidase [Coniochaeta sp. PMI_546]